MSFVKQWANSCQIENVFQHKERIRVGLIIRSLFRHYFKSVSRAIQGVHSGVDIQLVAASKKKNLRNTTKCGAGNINQGMDREGYENSEPIPCFIAVLFCVRDWDEPVMFSGDTTDIDCHCLK